MFLSIVYGVGGGLVRALVGIAKYFETAKAEKKIKFGYLGLTLLIAAIVGGLAGALVNSDWRLAVIAGYAGTDFLEGLYKIRMKQGLVI